jgi:hypothetical protein
VKAGTVVAIASLAACTSPPSGVEQQQAPLELAGRTAGPPQRCVPIVQSEGLRISQNNPHVLVYGSGRVVWANNVSPCRFGSDDILVTEPFGSSHCRGDIARSIDRISHIPGPACVMGDFVPYTR